MTTLAFTKYTAFGNNFVVIDEVDGTVLPESHKPRFGYHATNPYFGVGCDNLLVVQACTPETLAEINAQNAYWDELPDANSAEYIFRMFEPNGEEALSCGNGLMSIARHLQLTHGVESARIMTQVPLKQPLVITIGANACDGTNWANMGGPRRMPEHLASSAIREPMDAEIDRVESLELAFRSHDLKAYTDDTTLPLSGYMVFTGEPHLVIFPDECFSNSMLSDAIFSAPSANDQPGRSIRNRLSVGSWLVRRIGAYLNDHYREHFPQGLSVNFARVNRDKGVIEYRCFERGINRETLACGTGAVAVAFVARRLGLIDDGVMRVLPNRCRWHEADAEIRVMQAPDAGWCLTGSPRKLFAGSFELAPVSTSSHLLADFGTDTLEQIDQEQQYLAVGGGG